MTTRGRDSSTMRVPCNICAVTSARRVPSSSPSKPIRRKADNELGLAKVTRPSRSRRIKPSEALGAPCAGALGVSESGKNPSEIIKSKSLAHWLNVSSWRLGILDSLRFVCRVITAITGPGSPLGDGDTIRMGTARTLVGVESKVSESLESTMLSLVNASLTSVAHSGLMSVPTTSR